MNVGSLTDVKAFIMIQMLRIILWYYFCDALSLSMIRLTYINTEMY